MPVSQDNSPLAINTPLGDDVLVVISATITEQLGRLFSMELELSSEDPALDFTAIVGGNCTIRLELDKDATRYFNGYVSRFVQTDADSTVGGKYRATLVPWLWLLTRTADCRIFQKMTVPDIIKQIFRDQGFSDFKDSLSGEYTAWENCVQYRETDFNFVSRLMEHEGIYYFFTHENGKHTLVLADDISAHAVFPNYDTINYRTGKGGVASYEAITTWMLEQEVQPGAYALNDFNFETPKTSLLAKSLISTANAQSSYEMYDYPGEYGLQGEGTDYSKIRIEELHAQHEIVQGSGNVRGLATGSTFTLANAPRRDQNRAYLITSAVTHLSGYKYGSGGGGADGGGGDNEELFACSFSAIDSTKPFRAARTTPKPLIQGPQTAMVVGPSGEEIHTDEYGRIVVQFHWDRYGKADENSSCWVRVSQAAWAGKQYGAMYIPRVGQEVIVEFLEGDPDLPIVTGRVYNADATVPYALPANKTMTTLKSASSKGANGFNELRFEDKAGSEQLFMHAEKNMDLRVKADRMETVGNDSHLHVVNNQFEKVDANYHMEIGVSSFEKIATDDNLDIGGKQAIHVVGSQSTGVDGDMITEVGGNQSDKVTGKITYTAQGDFVIESAASISIKVGGSYLFMDSSKIELKATQIKITGDSTVEIDSADIKVAGSSSVKVSGAQIKVAADAAVEVTGGSTGKFDGGGATTIAGGLIKIG